MAKLSKADVKAMHSQATMPAGRPGETVTVHTASLDPERDWITAACPNGHDNVVQDHAGGSRSECGTCGVSFDWGGFDSDTARIDALVAAASAPVDREAARALYAKDAARSSER